MWVVSYLLICVFSLVLIWFQPSHIYNLYAATFLISRVVSFQYHTRIVISSAHIIVTLLSGLGIVYYTCFTLYCPIITKSIVHVSFLSFPISIKFISLPLSLSRLSRNSSFCTKSLVIAFLYYYRLRVVYFIHLGNVFCFFCWLLLIFTFYGVFFGH
jgi:hypothetical protein